MVTNYYDKIDPQEIIFSLKETLTELRKINSQLNTQQEVKMVKKLPELKGYTVDERLRQFRKVDKNKPSIDFVNFDFGKGKELLAEYESQE
jgi:hypothetical protein